MNLGDGRAVHHHRRRQRPGPVGPVRAAHHPGPAARHVLGPRVRRRRRPGPAAVQQVRRNGDRRPRDHAQTLGHDDDAVGDDERSSATRTPTSASASAATATWKQVRRQLAVARRVRPRRVQQHGAGLLDEGATRSQGRNFLKSALVDPIAIGEPAIYSSRWIEDGSFVRLQNVTRRLHASTCPRALGGGRDTRVYLSGDNLLLFTPYSGYDPEVFVGTAGLASRGIDYLDVPARPHVHDRRPHPVLIGAPRRTGDDPDGAATSSVSARTMTRLPCRQSLRRARRSPRCSLAPAPDRLAARRAPTSPRRRRTR